MEIWPLDELDPNPYESFLSNLSHAMFTQSLRYRDFLLATLPKTKSHYLCAVEKGQVVGVLPLMSKDGPIGAVFNSLPFFGSHGGVILGPKTAGQVGQALIDEARRICLKENAFSMTIVESPFGGFSHSAAGLRQTDKRIGQLTVLPGIIEEDSLEEILMKRFHKKTRNAIRKASTSGFTISVESSKIAMTDFWAIHEENMAAIGAQPKNRRIIEAILSVFETERDFRLYLARNGSEIVSGLLVFYFQDFAEYWMPATKQSHRSQQPLSLLISQALQDAVRDKGSRYWNWGGTWESQSGLHSFKSRWGTRDFDYHYYTEVFNRDLLSNLDVSDLLSAYEGFYLAPIKDAKLGLVD